MSKRYSADGPLIVIGIGAGIAFFLHIGIGVFVLILGGLFLLIRISAAVSDMVLPSTKKCPFCAEDVRVDAKVCRYCGRDLVPAGPATSAGTETVGGEAPDQLMTKFGITFDGEKYRFGEYRYDRLEDAVNYAQRQLRRSG